jgi:very-short-patch-repair endonuclease
VGKHKALTAPGRECCRVDIYSGLELLGGVAKANKLASVGVSKSAIARAVRKGTVSKYRKGWYGFTTLHPFELKAVSSHAFLTCSSAALVRNLPVDVPSHFHLQSNRGVKGEISGRRRHHFAICGALVSLVDMAEDYLHCQRPEWSLALIDALCRDEQLSVDDWGELENRLPRRLRELVAMRSRLPESPLESVVRYWLTKDRIPYEMQRQFGRYRVDFLIGPGIVLETHGAEFHANREAWERDRARTLWLRNQGLDVLEVTFNQVRDWPSIRSAIRQAQRAQGHRHLSP